MLLHHHGNEGNLLLVEGGRLIFVVATTPIPPPKIIASATGTATSHWQILRGRSSRRHPRRRNVRSGEVETHSRILLRRRPPRPNARGYQRQVPKLEIFRFEARFNRRRPEKCELPVRRGTLREGEKGGRGCTLGGERLPSYLAVKRERETQFSLELKRDKYITHTHANL